MIVVGIDGGGTKTKGTAVECTNGKGKIISTYETEGSNFHNVGLKRARERILKTIRAITRGNFPDLVVLGLAGLDSRHDYKVLYEGLNDLGMKVIIDNDSYFLLYSQTRGGKGVLTISGTGSVVLGVDGERRIKAEGVGWFLSDTGSAYWAGRKALRHLTRVLQGLEKPSPMSNMIMKYLRVKDVDDLVYWIYHKGHRVEKIASIAKIIDKAIKDGDEVARSIMLTGSQELATSAVRVAKMVGVDRVFVVGGMFNSKLYIENFNEVLLKTGMRAIKINHDPSYGALMYALDKINCEVTL